MKPQDPGMIRMEDYTYDLPEDRIAKFPLAERERSKLLVYRKGSIQEDLFLNLAGHLDKDSLLLFNSTRVIPARINFNHDGKRIEIFCLESAKENLDPGPALLQHSPVEWNCLVGRLKSWKRSVLVLEQAELKLEARIVEKRADQVRVEFSWNNKDMNFSQLLSVFGAVPIPPYLQRNSTEPDKHTYQTTFASQEGSVAAPTAGLHFSEKLLTSLNKKGLQMENICLHVGAGTFQPVKSLELRGHHMHREWMVCGRDLLENLIAAEHKKRICVGTTTLRCMESLYWMGAKAIRNPKATLEELEISQWEVYEMDDTAPDAPLCFKALLNWMEKRGLDNIICKTSILIAPPYRVRTAKALITNFHQPQSTLLLLVAACVGEAWRSIYKHALSRDYRFLSYGDGMLLWLNE
ncbi:MAG TPA: S-adenosylmethionine:tRNA ribosyltransferase-isomerase [Bacteroidia bacterium]|nr:S-adenosylmethionine:tRNA ribosyltransferase-isomerase [Bacteroidia bacterium]